MHAQMERMKSEAVVDVFQFIKSVRFQRAGLVANRVSFVVVVVMVVVVVEVVHCCKISFPRIINVQHI